MNKARIFIWVVTATALACFGTAVAVGGEAPGPATFLFWVGLLAAAELLPVSLGYGAQVTMSFPILLALAIAFREQVWVAMAIAGLGALDLRELKREIPIERAAFNRALNMLTVGAATLPFAISGNPFRIVPVTIAALLHLMVELGVVSTFFHFERGRSYRETMEVLVPGPALGFWVSYGLLAGLGVVIAIAYERLELGELAVAAILIPLLFARLSIIGARAQQELSERIQKQQQALLEATEQVFQEREKERHRIAAEIHDSSLQLLAAAAYGVGNAKDLIAAGSSDKAIELITSSRQAIDDAMKELRESLVDLRQSTVEEGGLLPTVQHYAEQLGTLWGTEVVIEGELSKEPPLPVALAAFQILQEGLVNALKHAQNSSVVVRIGDVDGMVHIVVEDQGPGFDPTQEVGADHVGMRLMRERAERVGGRIELDSKVGIGTRLEAILPGGVTQ